MSFLQKKFMMPESGGVPIEDVFSTFVYTGTGAALDIVNGVNLSDNGGLVWSKWRSGTNAFGHALFDTARGATKQLVTESIAGETTQTRFTAFNSDGYSLSGDTELDFLGDKYVSWTFRKAPRFFDVVTYTGDGVNSRNIPHELGVLPGMIIIKRLDSTSNWPVWHRNVSTVRSLFLNLTDAQTNSDDWGIHTKTDIVFGLAGLGNTNTSGAEYVAYIYAHDPLGESGDGRDGLISCGSYNGNSNVDGPEINLGWEPQYILIKNKTQTATPWMVLDTIRGLTTGSTDNLLHPNTSQAENGGFGVADWAEVNATGFKLKTNGSFAAINASGSTYVYMAIRRPMETPGTASEVFAVSFRDGVVPAHQSGFPVDLSLNNFVTGGNPNYPSVAARITGTDNLISSSTAAAVPNTQKTWDYMDGYGDDVGVSTTIFSYMWKRATGFFDVVAYTGDGVAGRTVAHNLGIVPEMIWVKGRDTTPDDWEVYHILTTATKKGRLNNNGTFVADSTIWNDTEPALTVFSVGTANAVNVISLNYIAYLFATLPGISKVGSFTGNGTSQTIACGFAAGARFILIKRTDATGDWFFWDSVRGIVAGNDPHLSLNTTAAEVTTDDSVDPESTGFIVNQDAATNINVNLANFIFYAVA